MTTDNFCFYLQNRLIQTSQTGGQWYSDTSPFSIPCFIIPQYLCNTIDVYGQTFARTNHTHIYVDVCESYQYSVLILCLLFYMTLACDVKADACTSQAYACMSFMHCPGNTKGGSFTVPLTSCLTGLDQSALQIKTKIVSCHTADSKLVKQEVNCTVILPPLVFPG